MSGVVRKLATVAGLSLAGLQHGAASTDMHHKPPLQPTQLVRQIKQKQDNEEQERRSKAGRSTVKTTSYSKKM